MLGRSGTQRIVYAPASLYPLPIPANATENGLAFAGARQTLKYFPRDMVGIYRGE